MWGMVKSERAEVGEALIWAGSSPAAVAAGESANTQLLVLIMRIEENLPV